MLAQEKDLYYTEVGEGDPLLFVHGVPTSSYLWRHVIPACQSKARCIAVDLIGFGQSKKPDIAYTIHDHIDYLTRFINEMALDNITLVLHGWGSIPGLHFAARNEDRLKSVVLYEPHIRPVTDGNMLSLPVQELAVLLKDKKQAEKAILEDNFFIERWLNMCSVRKLPESVLAEYRKPFQTPENRRPLWQYAQELPLGNHQTEAFKVIRDYNHWLRDTQLPICLMYAVPGLITPMETVVWAKDNIDNLTLIELEHVMHYAQESNPTLFSDALLHWLKHF